jgi:psiF repeat
MLSQDRYPSVATARDNGHPSLHKNIAARKCVPAGFIHPRFSIAARRCPFLQPEVPAMMTISSRAIATAFASMLLMGSAFAQATTPAAKTDTKAPMVHSAASLECSKEADAKGLHGKERKKFRSECKRAAAEKK